MTASHAVETSLELVGQFQGLVDTLRADTLAALEQWEQLGRLGAQCDDHAASLLNGIRARLVLILDFAKRCKQQVVEAQTHPFGKEESDEEPS